jgi:hypothetical protein
MGRARALGRMLGAAVGGLLLAGAPVQAQSQPPAPAPCSGPEHHQLDFWIGNWDVTNPSGKPAGTDRVEPILGGCVLFESWKSANGKSEGHSFTIRAQDGKWHQTWVDNGGQLLELVGGLEEGPHPRMAMSQERIGPDGKKTLNEVSWTQLDSGQVKQHWRVTTDGGQTWKDVFVGTYTRHP